MRLSDLLRERREAILQEFEDFARTHTAPGITIDIEALRDHAAAMLDAMALDLEQAQTAAEQERKGKGDAVATDGAPLTAAEEHGLGRAQSGFSMEETFAEYRALRASVMRHYVAELSDSDHSKVLDLIRFNEAIDQALAESVTEYAHTVSRYRDMFLAVLGHDLRSPLNAVLNALTLLAHHSTLPARERGLATTAARSATAMASLVEDLLAYTSDQLGRQMSLQRSQVDLGEIAAEVVREAELVRPDRKVRLAIEGNVIGEWDAGRLRQAVSNLVTNALRHTAEHSTVTVLVAGADGRDVIVTVHNIGATIPEHERELIFLPFRRATPYDHAGGSGSRMGLGLYIARRMVEAHGGGIEVESSTAGTTFVLRLPRQP